MEEINFFGVSSVLKYVADSGFCSDANHGRIVCDGTNTEGRNGEGMVKGARFRANSACYPGLSRNVSGSWNGWLPRKAFRHAATSENNRSFTSTGKIGLVSLFYILVQYMFIAVGPFIFNQRYGKSTDPASPYWLPLRDSVLAMAFSVPG